MAAIFGEGKFFLKIAKSTFLRYPVGQKFRQNRSISHGLGDMSTFAFFSIQNSQLLIYLTRGMLLLTKAKRPLKFKMLCGFNKHAVKLRMHKAAPYAFPIPLNTF